MPAMAGVPCPLFLAKGIGICSFVTRERCRRPDARHISEDTYDKGQSDVVGRNSRGGSGQLLRTRFELNKVGDAGRTSHLVLLAVGSGSTGAAGGVTALRL